jgi:hypothetical protein
VGEAEDLSRHHEDDQPGKRLVAAQLGSIFAQVLA